MTLLCIAPGCSVPRHHTKTCTDDDCRGCLPAVAEVGQLCERDFNHQATVLMEIGELYERLAAGWPQVADERTYVPGDHTDDCMDRMFAAVEAGFDAGLVDKLCRGCLPGPGLYRDPMAIVTPAGPVSRNGGAPKVSGTPGRSVPTSLDVLDLLAPARIGTVSSRRSYDPGSYWTDDDSGPTTWVEWHDQAGQPSVAAVLDLWARDWHTYTREALPDPTVPDLLRWLRARWEWAAKHHPAVDDFIRETGKLRGRLIAVLGEREPLPELCLGVACRKCDERNLWRRADGSGDVDCHSCGLIYRPSEYAQWVSLLAASARRDRRVDAV